MADVRLSRKLAVEFLGTAALVVCGPGTAAATFVIAKSTGVAFSMAQLGIIALAFMMVIIAMIYTIGHISGCHINPAVTLALAAAKKTPWAHVPGYLAAQLTGGITGAFAIWSILEQPGLDAGLGVLSYTPGHTRSTFCAELIGTFLLLLVVFGTTDRRATPGWYGLAIPSIVFAVITVVGPVTGAALNPARYLGPMIATAALDGSNNLLWDQTPIYLTATLTGGLLAAAAHVVWARWAASGPSHAVVAPVGILKKLINEPDGVLVDALNGVAAAHPGLSVNVADRYVARAGGPRSGKVGLVSGGGSGHEPLHGGFVGYGMLDAACPGEVFTSPVPDQILAATKAVDAGSGVLHIVKNYTGDVLNFQMAAELAADSGVRVESVLVDDDVAVENSTWTAGRRGTGATVFVEKIVGAAAEQGADLATAAALGKEVNERSRSFGVALTACTVPAAGKPGFELAEDEIELGVGIHGEPGRTRGKLVTAKEITAIALDAIHADMPLSGEVLVMVNGMGGTPLIELYVVFDAVATWMTAHGVRITRSLVGNYITSLEMAGCSITVCRLTPQLTQLWDAPVDTPALRWGR
jgi:phosphoenolpyruvate---glycerone phosphotransferase subunit DhaK